MLMLTLLQFGSLLLKLHLLLLHGLKASSKSRDLLRIGLILLIASLKNGEQFLIIRRLSQNPHDSGREEEGDEVVEVKT